MFVCTVYTVERFAISTSLNSSFSSVKASVSYSQFADPAVFSARSVTLCLSFAFIYFNHKSYEQPLAHPHR